MPIRVDNDLPAREVLESENIFMMGEERADTQQIRPLEIVILNLMPLKQDYEIQLLRALSNTPLQVNVTCMNVSSHVSKHTSASHINKFYTTFEAVRNMYFDGLIITGAPVETMEFEEVSYWEELASIMEWSKTNVTSTFHICWGALAGLYYHYGIQKTPTGKKLSGVYSHRLLDRCEPIVRSFDDVFYAPQSRATEVTREQILNEPELELMAESDIAGVTIVKSKDSRQLFVLCHLEYDADTLKLEYERDKAKGMNPEVAYNYFPDDDPTKEPVVNWRSAGQLLWTNWINYYVYQTTPYDIKEVENE